MLELSKASDRLGDDGLKGVTVLLGGLLVISYENRVITIGTAIVVAGIGLIAKGVIESTLQDMGLDGVF